jgi:Cdc6-like AAA superfamily ATPase
MIHRRPHRSVLPLTSLFLGLALGVPAASLSVRTADAAGGQGGAPNAASASASASSVAAGVGGAGGGSDDVHDPRVAEVRALIDGTLDPAVAPQSLFDVPLTDESAVRVEAVRVQALLSSIDAGRVVPPSGAGSPTPPASGSAKATSSASAGASASGSVEPAPPPPPPASTAGEAELWRERIELDRARLAFYRLTKARRDELLAGHQQRQEAARPKESAEERRAREVEAERQKALEAARVARSEAERLVSEELARLIGLEASVATARDHFREARTALTSRQDAVLGWQRRVKGVKAANATESADAVYDALRKDLKGARDDLDNALDDLQSPVSQVPELGADPLVSIPPEVSADQVRARRATVAAAIGSAKDEEQALREQRAATLLDEASALDHERLSLLPSLSAEKRNAITGFSPAGWEQARAEARQLLLILRYHRQAAADWAFHLRQSGARGLSWWSAAAVLVPWLLLSLTFSWWRRRSGPLLVLADKRLEEDDRAERRVTPSPARLTLHFFREIRRPLEWLTFFSLLFWLLPPSLRGLLEVELFGSIVRWTLGGALVVDVINALAEGTPTGPIPSRDQESVATLRLRSLRLVGRVAVAFLLVLVLSARLVGEGTLYSWVLSTCWMAAIPIFLILVRWWRETVFERVERTRKKTEIEEWVLAKRTGWQSFLAAMVGAVHLFATGTVKLARRWVNGFNLARRAHAYLFKRELDRLTSAKAHELAHPLDPEAHAVMAPDAPHEKWVSSPADAPLASLRARLAAGKGGVVALVGERGGGKSSLLRELASSVERSVLIDCVDHPGFDAIRDRLAEEVGPRSIDPSKSAADQPKSVHAPLVLLDEAQVMIKPVIGGLRTFDDVVAFARTRCQDTLWVIAVDAVLWPFLARARDTRPMFDDILTLQSWDEEQIGALLNQRLEQAGVTATFEDLLEELPASADEFDRQDALTERRLGYVRMLWDHVRGNPGLALEVWRGSLAEDTKGAVRVRSLQVPDGTELETLPDSTLFIFRAILQLAPATPDEIVTATRLSTDQVQNALRYAEARGYLTRTGSTHDILVSWRWLRPVLRLLERRHLLVSQ